MSYHSITWNWRRIPTRLLCALAMMFPAVWHVAGQSLNNLTPRVYTDAQGSYLPYRLFVPPNYVATNRYPLLLYLHAADGNGTDNQNQLQNQSPLAFIRPSNAAKYPSFMLAPQCPYGFNWNSDSVQQMLLNLLNQLQAEFSIDPDRWYIMGGSMGGFGTWDLITRHPGLFAAAIPMSANADPFNPPVNPPPVWAFHSADDPSVPVNGERLTIKLLRDAGATPLYTEYVFGGHFQYWPTAYQIPQLLDWLMAQRRGQPSGVPPLITRLIPAQTSPFSTSASTLSVSGIAVNAGVGVDAVTWTNNTGSHGTANGTDTWSVTALPLVMGTNHITLVASGTSFIPSIGGSTTFNTSFTVVREAPVVLSLSTDGLNLLMTWTGGVPPFQIEASDGLMGGWSVVLTTSDRTATFPLTGAPRYYRVTGQ